MSIQKTNTHGFTLVELLIVVIILAILAAVVFPQFSSSTDDAKSAALQSNLTNIRSAIEFYFQEHGEYPGENIATGATCATGGAGAAVASGAANSEDAFIAQLTRYTNDEGLGCTGKGTIFKYGPYIKGVMPLNPMGTSSTVAVVSAGVLGLATASTGGWRYDTVTGEFISDQ